MTNSMPISRRSFLGGLAAAAVVPAAVAATPSQAFEPSLPNRAFTGEWIVTYIDTVPEWYGPGLYEVAYEGGR
ncbi:twin-arginine translocation signal domain-containing protein [Mesorhizobium sp. B3-1-6]|uniref:twin-arginine translocation signal domain-containing protein n=1 Tax=Mesorhizobium sp. B3-1-6 TaxID=2589895 RepID=UPI00112B8602|nr:twin-arginine translocation signal domain-containing protein [Mesorhizobium sp. B3-1-6]TPI31504.1 twin-arginine translocation signal domain-containing protein [Mesorhizobium sp. B3-1-6]